MAEFHLVEANLRESFRALARGRERSDVFEWNGISVASLGVTFQMFNAGFLNAPAAEPDELEDRIDRLRGHFASRGMEWSFWVCEDWLTARLQRRLSRVCEMRRAKPSSEMPGMLAWHLRPLSRALPEVECRRVACAETLRDFRAIGALCFHVPPDWFGEVFDERVTRPESRFVPWVGYLDGEPVATAATVTAHGTVGLYNLATTPKHRKRGFAEALTRHACAAALGEVDLPIVLQSSSLGYRMYERMGFHPVTRIVVYNSF